MNTETTCCQDGRCDSGVSETNETTLRYSEPVWSADRHDRGVQLQVTLPGVKKEQLKLEVHGRQLLLEAKREASKTAGKLIYGPAAPEAYRLKLRLGENLDGAALKANLNDGILEIEIPLVEAAQPRKVEVH